MLCYIYFDMFLISKRSSGVCRGRHIKLQHDFDINIMLSFFTRCFKSEQLSKEPDAAVSTYGFRQCSSIVIIGRRGTGKSTVIANILRDINVSRGVIVQRKNTPLPIDSPHVIVENEYNPQTIATIIETTTPLPFFIVLDDCVYNSNWYNGDNNAKYLLRNHTAKNIWFIQSLQCSMRMAPSYRMNLDYVILLPEQLRVPLKNTYDLYANKAFASFKDFQTAMQSNVNKRPLCIDNRDNSYRWL